MVAPSWTTLTHLLLAILASDLNLTLHRRLLYTLSVAWANRLNTLPNDLDLALLTSRQVVTSTVLLDRTVAPVPYIPRMAGPPSSPLVLLTRLLRKRAKPRNILSFNVGPMVALMPLPHKPYVTSMSVGWTSPLLSESTHLTGLHKSPGGQANRSWATLRLTPRRTLPKVNTDHPPKQKRS